MVNFDRGEKLAQINAIISKTQAFHILISLKSECVLQSMPLVIGSDFIVSLLVPHKIMELFTLNEVLDLMKF
jgi:hypothetical protein